MMKRTLLFLVGLVLTSVVTAAPGGAAPNANVTFSGGVCKSLSTGGYELTLSGGQQLLIEPTWVKSGWAFEKVTNAKRSATVKDGKLVLTFEANDPSGLLVQDDGTTMPMLIIVSGDGSSYPGGLFRLDDSHTATLDDNEVWGYDSHFESDALSLRFFLDHTCSFSFNNYPETKEWNIRVPTVGEMRREGLKYKGTISLAVTEISFDKPLSVKVAEQKMVQYRRVLVPPQEKGFDPTAWLAVCDNPNSSNADFVRIERLMDLRSQLYTLADCLRHRATGDDEAEGLVTRAYAALNTMDAETAEGAIASLDARLKALDGASGGMRPLSGFSPYSWIKSFTQWGYVRSPDGHCYFEPTPWNMLWEDGFRCNVDQDARVAIAKTTSGKNFYETRYLGSMADVSFERDWVSTKWRFPNGKTVTFSLLTPVVDVDGVTELKMSGFSAAPDSIQLMDNQGREKWILLTEEADFEEEVLSSASGAVSAPAVVALGSMGEVEVNPDGVGRPWLRLNIPHDRGLILLPEARPVAVSWINGVLTVKFAQQGYVGIVRPPANLYAGEYPEVAEFFARTAAAYPVSCRETVSGRTCTWQYAFRERTNAWSTEPSRIAPVPPLADLAGVHCAGEKAFLYPTKWGVMRYVPGATATCELPASTPCEPKSFCGVNSSIWEPVENELAVVTNGYMGVRLLTTRDKTVEESCERFEEVLAVYRRYGIKVLMDAHNSVYDVWWQDGITDSDDFVAMWSAFSSVGAKYKDVVVGYDLYNEPGTGVGSEELWRQVCTRAAQAILANHPEAKIYYPGLSDGNPNGMANLRPLDLGGARQVMTYHFYLPHSFTHQKSVTLDEGGDTCVFYPAWAYPTDWSAGNHFAGTTVDWYDKWALGAMLLPAFEHYAKYGIAQHVGEFSVIGYANGRSPLSAGIWTRDSAELFDHIGATWHLWNGGFGLGNTYVQDWFFSRMRENAAVSSVTIR